MIKALELAKIVLENNNLPLTVSEIFEYAQKNYSDKIEQTFSGDTPVKTLGSCLYVDSKKINSEFCKYKDGKNTRFGLKSKSLEYDDSFEEKIGPVAADVNNLQSEDENVLEKKLHKFLVSYMRNQHGCYCKTISANRSENKVRNKNKWVHPDIIGVKFFKEYFNNTTLELMQLNNDNLFELYSFELKREITLSNVDDVFFQAAANSSWANYGYLVTNNIDLNNSDLKEKINRLSKTFGIGVIILNLVSFNQSDRDMIPAQYKSNVDYEFIKYLTSLKNDDINSFFEETIAICKDSRRDVLFNKFDSIFSDDPEGEKFARDNHMI